MAGNEGGYRPSLVFAVTVLLLLVAGACMFIWIGRAGDVRETLDRLALLEKKLAPLPERLKPFEALVAQDIQAGLAGQGAKMTTLARDFASLKLRMDAIKIPATAGGTSSALRREVAALKEEFQSLDKRLTVYQTTGDQRSSELDRRLKAVAADRESDSPPSTQDVTKLRSDVDDLASTVRKLEGRPAQAATLPGGVATQKEVRALEKRVAKLGSLPAGTIVPWLVPSSLRRGRIKAPQGWAICDGRNGAPDLDGLMLMGTTTAKDVGKSAGSSRMQSHWHHRRADNTKPGGEGVIRVQGATNHTAFNQSYWFAPYTGSRLDVPAPPHVKVVYIMKIKNP